MIDGVSLESVRVIVVAWNAGMTLSRCVRSFLAEGIREDHIFISDNGTTDGSISDLRKSFGNVSVVPVLDNRSYGGAINRAAQVAGGEIIVIANPDTVVQPGSLGTLLATLLDDPRRAIVGPRIQMTDGSEGSRLRRTSMVRALSLLLQAGSFAGTFKRWHIGRYNPERAAEVAFIEGSFMVVRRSAFDLVGGFDERFTFFSEDADLSLRLRKHGFVLAWDPRSIVHHEGGHAFGRAPAKRTLQLLQGLLLFYHTHAFRRYRWFRMILSVVSRFANLAGVRSEVIDWRQLEEVVHRESYLPTGGALGRPPRTGLVSVVIPTCDRVDSCRRLLAALEQESYRSFEVIVVDQGTRDHIDEKEQRSFPLVFVRSKSQNRSLAKDMGARRAQGEIILFCDDDIIPDGKMLAAHVDAHQRADIGGVSCRMTQAGSNDVVGDQILQLTSYGQIVTGFASTGSRRVGMLIGGNMSFKAAAWRESTGFDTALVGSSVLEEPECGESIQRRGWILWFSDASTVLHDPQPSGNDARRGKDPITYFRDLHANMMYLFLKHRPRWQVPGMVTWAALRSVRQGFKHRISIPGQVRMWNGLWIGAMNYYGLVDLGRSRSRFDGPFLDANLPYHTS